VRRFSLARVFADAAQWRLAGVLSLLMASVLLPDINLSRKTFEYMVTFDVTQSMNVEDVELDARPVRRLVLARAAMRDVLRNIPCGSKVGWSVFSGYRSFVLLRPIEVCANYEVLLSSLDKIGDPMRWANASNIGKGVYWAMHNAKILAPARFVFITDGQEAPPIDPGDNVAPPTEPGEVEGLLVGVGSIAPSRIPKTDSRGIIAGYWTHEDIQKATSGTNGNGHEELSERRDPYLSLLAQHNSITYEPLSSVTSLTDLLTQERWSLRTEAPTNIRWVVALLALLLLIWSYLPSIPQLFHKHSMRVARRSRSAG
jgi:mxaL protein